MNTLPIDISASQQARPNQIPDELAMAINRARSFSGRNGMAWLLFENNKLIASRTCVSGDPVFVSHNLSHASSRNRHLFVSSPPHKYAYSVEEIADFTSLLCVNSVTYPTLTPALDALLAVAPLDIDGVDITTVPLNRENHSLFFGPATLAKYQRPWTSCFVSMNSQGQGVPYEHFLSGFGASSTFHHSVLKHAVVAIQENLVTQDAKVATLKETNCTIDITSSEHLSQLQQKLSIGKQSTLVALCDYPFFSQLAETDTVDECMIYIALTELSSPNFFNPMSDNPSHKVPHLTDWKVTETFTYEAGVLIQMRRKSNRLSR